MHKGGCCWAGEQVQEEEVSVMWLVVILRAAIVFVEF